MIYPVKNISIIKQSNGTPYHGGKSIDFGWWGGHHQDILSCDDGKVYLIQKQPKGGNVIYIKHNNKIISAYAHLQSICVKKSQKVVLGQKIGTMGATGVVSAEHLHFGLYTQYKNLGGNADLDPLKYCLVYPEQKICKNEMYNKYKNKIKYYEEYWTTGVYKLLYKKAWRKTHKIANNIYQFVKAGTDVRINEIYKEGTRVWGKCGAFWFVLCNKDGTKQATKIG